MMLFSRLCRPVLIVLALNLITQPAWAVFVWNRGNPTDLVPTANDLWSNADNWFDPGSPTPKNSAPPVAPSVVNERVTYPGTNSNNGTSVMDNDYILTAGLNISLFRGGVIFDLDGNRLTIDGADFLFGRNSNSPTMSNGTLQIGTPSNATLMDFFQQGSASTATISARIDAINVDSWEIAEIGGNFGTSNETADISGSTFSSSTIGAANNTLNINNDLVVARFTTTNGATARATLILPSSLTTLSADELVIGENTNTNTGNSGTADGTVNFGSSASLDLTVGSSLIIGRGDNATGAMTNMPAQLNLAVGSTGSPGVMQIGYKDRTQSTDNPTSGGLTSLGGTVDINLTELRVGQNTQSAGSATGVLDLAAGTLVDFNADNVFVGVGVDSTGSLLLPSGSASASNVVIGSTDSGANGLIDLAGTLMFVDTAVTINGPTDDQGVLISRIQGTSAGLDLSDSTTLTIGSGGLHNIRFEQESSSNDLYFGLRWEGSHVAELLSLQDSGALTITNLTALDISIFEEGGFTYVAALAPIPEPASGSLLLLGLAAAGWRSRKRAKR